MTKGIDKETVACVPFALYKTDTHTSVTFYLSKTITSDRFLLNDGDFFTRVLKYHKKICYTDFDKYIICLI